MKFFFRYATYLKPYTFLLILSLFAGLVFVASSALSIWLSADLIQALFTNNTIIPPLPSEPFHPGNLIDYLKHYSAALLVTQSPSETMRRAIVFILLAFLIKNLAYYAQALITTYVEQKTTRRMREEYQEKLLKQDLAFFQVRDSGDLVSAGVNDINQLNMGLVEWITKLVRDPLTILVFLLLLLGISWELTLASIVIAPLTGIAVAIISASLKRKSQRAQQKLSKVTVLISNMIYGMRIIQAYGGHKYEEKRFQQATGNHFRETLGRERTRRLMGPVNEQVGIMVIAVILLLAGSRILGGDWIAPQDFVRFLLMLFGVLNPAVSLGEAVNNLKIAEGAAERVFKLMDTEHHIKEHTSPMPVDGFSNKIRFQDVSLVYDPNRPPAVQSVSLSIPKGEKVVFVGRSGSGKSTLLNMLPRFFDPSSGAIFLDDVDIREYKIRDLRRLFGVVTQEIVLFNATVRENIAYQNPNISLEKIILAAKQAQAHEFIEQLPQGYDTNLGDLGESLSGGQRQRLSIARALLNDPPILLLDEPTSSLDSDVAEEIMQTLETVGQGRTMLLATHRLASISSADRIVFLAGGRLIAEGSHSELLQKVPEYSELHAELGTKI